jgi:putative restriction endonuclease
LRAIERASPSGALRSADINRFTFEGRAMPLIVQTGIWKPAMLQAALTIRTTYTRPNEQPPYLDDLGGDGLVRYKYRGLDPEHSDNRALREAMMRGAQLAYFIGIESGVYVAEYPVWIVGEDIYNREFMVAMHEEQRAGDQRSVAEPRQAYIARLVKERLHQPVFRARVLRAYEERCAMCRLHHPELLDAAHIIRDGDPGGEPVVPNGLSLCKIHHGAFDADILGIRPDLVIEVRRDVLDEEDGPMLRYGLQKLHHEKLEKPRGRLAWPDAERLEQRYERFRAAYG